MIARALVERRGQSGQALLSQETMQRGGRGACVREPQGGEATGRESQ